MIDPGVSEMKVLLCRDGPDESVDAAVVAYLVLLIFCAYKFTEARVVTATFFMYPAYNKHSGAASNCCFLLIFDAHTSVHYHLLLLSCAATSKKTKKTSTPTHICHQADYSSGIILRTAGVWKRLKSKSVLV